MERQTVRIDDDAHFAGLLRFHGCPVPSNVFQRLGHACFSEVSKRYYAKTDDNLTCFEWQQEKAIPEMAVDGTFQKKVVLEEVPSEGAIFKPSFGRGVLKSRGSFLRCQ